MAYADNILTWLDSAINAAIAEHNTQEGALQLDPIAQSETGFRDVVTGLRAYPALCVAEISRDCADAYISKLRMSYAIALRGDDADELNRQGDAMVDILENVLREDHRLGGNALDSSNLTIDRATVSGVYVIAAGEMVNVENAEYGM